MKVVILCGGEGARLREETEYKPKPMVTIGGLPILWHIMKIYSHYGFNEFILCLGYKGDMVKDFFLRRELMANDFTIKTSDRTHDVIHRDKSADDWTITFAETGLRSNTGARMKRIEKYIDSDDFLATYGDGLANVDIPQEVAFHRKKGKVVTLMGAHPHSKFGLVRSDSDGTVRAFMEKPRLDDYVNGGYYVLNREIFDMLDADESCVLEGKVFEKLASEGKMAMYCHDDFWHAMDTYKDYLDLNKMWDSGNRLWKVWGD